MELRKHILIVDDDVELASLLAQAVNDVSEAYEVKVARDVDGAMVQVHKAQTAQHPFDLVITDIKMLGLSGLELLEALASIAPETKTITMTAYNSPDLAERAQQLNVFAYLTKPFVLSEFRQIVRSALYPDQDAEQAVGAPLSVRQKVAVGRHLATLRASTGSNVALLMHVSGVLLASDSLDSGTDIRGLCTALMNAQSSVAEHLKQAFSVGSAIQQSYFGAGDCNVCAYRLDSELFLAVIFGSAVREGQVWYYIREAAQGIRAALEAETELPVSRGTHQRNDLLEMIDQYFPPRTEPQATPPEAPLAEAAVERRAETAEPTPTLDPEPELKAEPRPGTEPEPLPVDSAPDLPSLDDMDWEVSTDVDWEEVAATTEQGFAGLSYEEAESQGLLALEDGQIPSTGETPEAEPAETFPRLDEIDWNVADDTGWEDIASTTDQGFTGISFEEARRRGLLGDVEPE